MKKRTIKFWTKEEDKVLEKMHATYPRTSDAARNARKILRDRTHLAIEFRIGTKFGRSRVNKKTSNKSVELPDGFSFDFIPKRAVMHKNRVELYW